MSPAPIYGLQAAVDRRAVIPDADEVAVWTASASGAAAVNPSKRDLLCSGETSSEKTAALLALLRAVKAIASLDTRAGRSPALDLWQDAERLCAAAQALARQDPRLDAALLFRDQLGAFHSHGPRFARSLVSACVERWRAVLEREQHPLRALVGRLSAQREHATLADLCDAIEVALADLTGVWALRIDKLRQMRSTDRADLGCVAYDQADVGMAVPYALRRMQITRHLLPSLAGPIQHLDMADRAPLARLTYWLDGLAAQTVAAEQRLARIEQQLAAGAAAVEAMAKPEPYRLIHRVACQLRSFTASDVHLFEGRTAATMRQLLASAESAGIVAHYQTRGSRGMAVAYTLPVWLDYAQMLPKRRAPLRPRATKPIRLPDELQGAALAVDAECAAVDRLLGPRANAPGNEDRE